MFKFRDCHIIVNNNIFFEGLSVITKLSNRKGGYDEDREK